MASEPGYKPTSKLELAKLMQARMMQRAAQAQARQDMGLFELGRLQPGDVRPPAKTPGRRTAADVGAGLDPASQARLLEAGELGAGALAAAPFLPTLARLITKFPKGSAVGGLTLDQLLGGEGLKQLQKMITGGEGR